MDSKSTQPEPSNDGGAPPPPRYQPPDGGWKARSTVVGCFAVLVATFGTVNTFGVFQSYYHTTLLPSYSNSALSWIGGVNLFLLYAGVAPLGKIFDAGYIHWMLFTGTVIYAAGMVSLSFCDHYYSIFLTQGVTVGVGLSLVFLPSQGIISHWFAKRRAFVLGIAASGSSVGGVVFPIMLRRLLVTTNFPTTIRVFAGVNVFCLIVANLCIKTALPPRKLSEIRMMDPAILHDSRFWTLAGSCFFVFWGLYMPIFYLTTFGEEYHLSGDISFYSLCILNGASVLGRTISGYLADRVGSLNVFTPCCGLCGIIISVWLACTKTYSYIIFAAVYGVLSGAFVSLLPAVLASMTQNMKAIGVRLGILLFIVSFAGLSGTPIIGAIMQKAASELGNGFWAAATFSGCSVPLGTAGLAVLTFRGSGVAP